MATIIITLKIDGDADHAMHVVEAMLDNGAIQGPINDHHAECNDGELCTGDDCSELHVTSALASFGPEE